MREEFLKVRTVDQVLYEKYIAGRITLRDAAREFHAHGWTNYVDEDYTRKKFQQISMAL